jgi:hypothetical protein
MLKQMRKRDLLPAVEALTKLFGIVGKPRFISGDMEFNKLKFIDAIGSHGIKFREIPRHHQQANVVERVHGELKKHCRKNKFKSLTQAVEVYNETVFCSLPKNQFQAEKLTPAFLYQQNPTKLLKEFVNFRIEQSKKRTTRQTTRLGGNLTAIKRFF